LIQKLSQQEKFDLNENLIFAIHWGGENVPLNSKNTENFKKWIERYYKKFNFIITFWTTAATFPEPDKGIDNKLKKTKPNITEKDFDLWFDTFKKRTIPLTTKLSLIKHSIMTSFLDLDIDWQGIKEVNEKDKESAKKYLNDILEKKSENYCQKLVNLWFYLTGNKDLKIESINSSLEKDKLPYKKSVLDLINESSNETKENLKKRWQILLVHIGLEIENNYESFFDNKNITTKKKSSIIDYLENLDSITKGKEDINKFLSFDFHKWYLKLGDLLDELKIFLE
jgi:hypothetical protein